jgi:hypothetical protein
MHFVVRLNGSNVDFRYSDHGGDGSWSSSVFAMPTHDYAAVKLAGFLKVLDCLGRRTKAGSINVWQISRDDLAASEIIAICRKVVVRDDKSDFNLTADVARAIAVQRGFRVDGNEAATIAGEVSMRYLANRTRGVA